MFTHLLLGLAAFAGFVGWLCLAGGMLTLFIKVKSMTAAARRGVLLLFAGGMIGLGTSVALPVLVELFAQHTIHLMGILLLAFGIYGVYSGIDFIRIVQKNKKP